MTFLFLFVLAQAALPAFRVEGVLLERGTKKPIVGATVHVLPKRLSATTDGSGHFVVDGVPVGPFQWAVRLSGYTNLDQDDLQTAEAPAIPRQLFLEKTSYQVYETTIHAGIEKRDAKAKTIEKEEFRAPGTSNDAIKAVQNLPGAGTPSFFSPALTTEGSAPEQTHYSIDGFRVPTVFHFGGFQTIVPPEALERVDFLTAGYGPEHGQALGGHVDAWMLSPTRERFQGFGFLDVFNLGGLAQGPTGDSSSYLASARFGYAGPMASVLASNTSLFSLTSTPLYMDASGIFQKELTPQATFRVLTVGSYDTLGLVLKGTTNKTIYTSNGFFRLIPEWTVRSGKESVLRLFGAIGKDSSYYQDTNFLYRWDAWLTSARLELEHTTTDAWKNIWGVETTFTVPTTGFTLPEFNKAAVESSRGSYATLMLSPYWRAILHPKDSPWTVSPGIRADYFSLTQEFLAQPRLEVRYALSAASSLHLASGLFQQAPADHFLDPSYGNMALVSERAWHATVGADFDFRGGTSQGITLSGDVFAKYQDQMIATSSTAGEHFNNSGVGRAYGIEAFLRAEYGDFKGWLSYTLSRSTRFSSRFSDQPYGYNQTHLLSALGAYTLPRNWRLSGRVRVLSRPPGIPLIEGSVSGIYLPKPGAFMSTELIPAPPLFQLDLRMDKSWVYNRWILSLFVDIANVTFSPSADGADLPIVPVLGAKAEF